MNAPSSTPSTAAQRPDLSGSAGHKAVRVWDLPTRLFHWLLAATVIGSVTTGLIGGGLMVWHLRLGSLAMALLAFRLLWGFVGGRWSRFASFVYAPGTVLRYLRGDVRAGEHLDVGHTPLGAGSVFALLAILIVQVGTGLMADDEIATVGPLNRYVSSATAALATGWHKNVGFKVILALALLHIGAILYYRWRKKLDLIGPMVSGDKSLPGAVPAARDDLRTRLLAVVIALACAAAAAWVMRLGG
jgi:cytochrome b